MLSFLTGRRIIAHRGLHGDRNRAPENSLRAFARAADAGYGIELDLRLSADGQVIVFHDDTLDRVCGVSGEVSRFTYEELQQFPLYGSDQRIPLFSQVMETVAGRVPLVIELKAAGARVQRTLCVKTAALLDDYRGEYCIESFHPSYLFWFRLHRPRVPRGQLCTDFFRTNARGKRWQFFLFELMATNLLTRPDFISYDIRFRHRRLFRFWKRFCTPVGWTLRPGSGDVHALLREFDYLIAERRVSSD